MRSSWPPAILTPVSEVERESGDGAEVVSFIEGLCLQVKDSVGGLAGSPMILRDWQKMLLADVFARRADGRRKHRTVSTGSVYRVLSSEAFTKKGLSPTCVIYDELPGSVKDA